MMARQRKDLNVGICGAGLGGLTAAIAIARGGARVTVLEAASQLGEIGAGIQMTPNVSRYLIKWGVADIIGEDLVQCKEVRMRRTDGKIVQKTELVPKTLRELGFPWWVVHRHHLHQGLSESARRHGVNIVIDARVESISHENTPVTVTTVKGASYTFDLLIGADGIKSVTRKKLFPNVKPRPPTANAAYRAIVPYEKLFREYPEAQELFGNSIDAWAGDRSYIITYPISGGKDLNLVLEHHTDHYVDDVEDVNVQEMRDAYKAYDPRIRRVVNLIPETKRWPLMITGPLESWSSPQKNVILMGDAAHSMVNHMAQGAATSMEDGAFLGRILGEVVNGVISLREAVKLYEQQRMPRAHIKQQVSFIMGATYMYEPGPRQEARDKSSAASVYNDQPKTSVIDRQERITGPDANARSWNVWGAPEAVISLWGYDAEGDADNAVLVYLNSQEPPDPHTKVNSRIEDKWTGWYLPKDQVGKIAKARI